MENGSLSVREIRREDVPSIVGYFLNSPDEFLTGMGVDLDKLPSREAFSEMLTQQIGLPVEQKRSYFLIWQLDEQPVGHTNINKIIFGKEAFMHLHLWQSGIRKKGMGTELVKRSLPFYFEKFNLQNLFCEPYALNPAPNKTLEKIGFQFEKEYLTVPGAINFEQPVKRWKMTKEAFRKVIHES